MSITPQLIVHRRRPSQAAIVMIHGFGGNAAETWGEFPALLEPLLPDWDIYSIGYSTSLAFDIAGIWSADPALITLGGLFETVTDVAPLDGYPAVAFMAHSMGGLLLQRALLANRALRQRTSHVLLYGTPSAGLEKASPFTFWKRQIRDMARDSTFIRELRQQWTAEIGATAPFVFVSTAGDRDEFVPRISSLEPFPAVCQRVVYGNHLEIVKPHDVSHLGFKVALKVLSGDDSDMGLVDSARRAVESRQFQQAIDTLGPHRQELDDQGLVTLALALESVGKQSEAIELLSNATAKGTDPLGVLAGRLKRRWLAERRRADAERALSLYHQGLERAEQDENTEQAYYHAINAAFMELAYGSDATATRALAKRALEHAKRSHAANVWRDATEGEAQLYLGNRAAARDAYVRAAAMGCEPWKAASVFQQAVRAADLMGEDTFVDDIREILQQSTHRPDADRR
jgi:pimeloyl-ACP methyl ester carboxylesterase